MSTGERVTAIHIAVVGDGGSRPPHPNYTHTFGHIACIDDSCRRCERRWLALAIHIASVVDGGWTPPQLNAASLDG